MKVVCFINDALKSYQEVPHDFLIRIYEGDNQLASEWIENFKSNASEYLDREIMTIEAYTEEVYVYI